MKHALRSLLKSPGFTLVAVLTLALGIGANTTFFSVLHGVVLRGLPYPRAAELVEIRNLGKPGENGGRISPAELRDYRAQQHSLAGLGAYSVGRATLSLDDGAERVVQIRVTANLFPLLGVQPAQGRTFLESEERTGNDRVVIISEEFRQRHFAGKGEVLGRSVRLNGEAHTIVGLMPPGFSFSPGEAGTGIWKPLDLSPRGPADRADRSLSTIARLAPGFSLSSANADLNRVARQLQADDPAAYPAGNEWSLQAGSLRQSQFGHLLAPLGALMSAAAAVLLIACVNVSIMFLLRAAVRRRDLMIRLAIGASRWHIIRHLLSESAIVCGLGAAAGLGFAFFGVELLQAFPPADIPRLQEVAVNGTVAAFTVGVLLLVTLAVGLAPALTLYRTRAPVDISQTARSTESRSAVRLREALTVVEVALAVMLLVGGGLAFRSLDKLLRDDVGFTTAQLFTFKTNLTPAAYPDLARANRFYEQLTARLEALPGVSSVAAVSYLPLSGESQFNTATPVTGGPGSTVAWRVVRGPYFNAMGITLLQGRLLDSTDRADSPPVAVVDDAFARRHWPTEDAALGQSVRFGDGDAAQTRTVVGIVRQVKHRGPGQDSLPEVFVPQAQFYQRGMYTVLKASGATNLVPLVRAELARVDPTIPMYFIQTMEQRFAGQIALPRFTAGLVGAFAALALVLAGVGIFGVTAYSVAQRSREFGIRIALGAPRSHVAGLVLGRTGRLALLGGAIGAAAAFQVAGLMKSLLFGVDPLDAPTLLVAAAVIVFTVLLASLVPLVRALRVSPVEALRAE
jgi:putative ABC transport system permease protein